MNIDYEKITDIYDNFLDEDSRISIFSFTYGPYLIITDKDEYEIIENYKSLGNYLSGKSEDSG